MSRRTTRLAAIYPDVKNDDAKGGRSAYRRDDAGGCQDYAVHDRTQVHGHYDCRQAVEDEDHDEVEKAIPGTAAEKGGEYSDPVTYLKSWDIKAGLSLPKAASASLYVL